MAWVQINRKTKLVPEKGLFSIKVLATTMSPGIPGRDYIMWNVAQSMYYFRDGA